MSWSTLGDIMRVPAMACAGVSLAILLPLIRARFFSLRRMWNVDIFSLLMLDLGITVLCVQEIIILILRVGEPPHVYGVFLVLPAVVLIVVGLYYRREVIKTEGAYMRSVVEEAKRGT